MAQHTLDNDFSDNISLYGLASHAKPYQLVSELNEQVSLHLQHSGKGIMPKTKREESIQHPYFVYEDGNNNRTYYLFVNYFNQLYLIPALKHAHYLLLVTCDAYLMESELPQYRKCQKILSFFDLNHQKNNFKQHIYQWTL